MTVYAVLIGQNSLLLLAGLLLLTGLTAVIHYRTGLEGYNISEKGWKLFNRFYYLLVETIKPANGKDIRLYRMKQWFGRAFDRMTDLAVENTKKEWTCYLHAGVAEKLLSLLRDGIIYGYLIAEMAFGKISLSRFLLYIGIVAGFGGWMAGLVTAIQEIMKNNGLMNRYRDFMEDGRVDHAGKKAVHAPGRAHEIRLEHVCFRYDGQDISEISKEAYFKEFSVVFQDVFAFSFPLEDNVSCAESDRQDRKKLESCLKRADLWEKVQGLEQGSKTVMNKDLDERGVTLSGGELQKLMLARALYKNAPVVILDEPTAALDPMAEAEVYAGFDAMVDGKTSVYISHRMSSCRFCDDIIVFDGGQIVERGSHEKLLADNGQYAKMWNAQAKYYA